MQAEAARAALERIGKPLRIDALNAVHAGKPEFSAMLVRDDEPGCSSILAQQLSDEMAEDLLTVIEFARHTHPTSNDGLLSELVEAAEDALTEINALRAWIDREVPADCLREEACGQLHKPLVTKTVTKNLRTALAKVKAGGVISSRQPTQ